MKYLVMETHPAYAVLLDESGRFLKAANLNYQVGDTVQNIIELKPPAAKKRTYLIRQITAVAAAAACFCLVFFGYYQPNYMVYGTIRIQINPQVEMTLSRTERVLDLEGLNADGADLIEGYDYGGKNRETVTHDLIQRAMDMGYLSNGDSVSISIDSPDTEWRLREQEGMRTQMEEEYGTQIVIYIGEDVEPEQTSVEEPIQVVIPAVPAGQDPVSDDGVSDYTPESEDDGVSDYTPESGDDGVSDYAPESGDDVSPVYAPENEDDGISDYSEEIPAPAADPVPESPDPAEGDSGYDAGGGSEGDSGYDAGDDAEGDSGYDDAGDDDED